MIHIQILAVGKLGEKHWESACAEYIKRLNAFCKPEVTEIAEFRLPKNPSQAQIIKAIEAEGVLILSRIPPRAYVVALCIEGDRIDSMGLSKKIGDVSGNSSNMVFIIGGSNGLSSGAKNRCDLRLSMSEMTFPHQLARVMLLEQIYRAFTIQSGTQYHK